MKGKLGSEVLLRVETLSEDNLATTDSLRAPVNTGLPSVAYNRAVQFIRAQVQ